MPQPLSSRRGRPLPKGAGATVLVVEDEESMSELLEAALHHEGYDVVTAASGRRGLEIAIGTGCDLVLLDVNLPDIDGFAVCSRLRQAGRDIPVIYLTARDGRDDLRAGFLQGGDDYITKPFSLEELVLRIGAVLTRSRRSRADRRFRYTNLELDDDAHEVRRGGQVLLLSPTEYRVLRYLLAHQGQVRSKQQILDEVWGAGGHRWTGDGNLVEAHISQLRKKIDTGHPPLIRTVRGFGYVLRSDDELR